MSQLIKKFAYTLGVEVRRAHAKPKSGEIPSFSDPFHEQRRFLSKETAPVIFDVGAHIGETSVKYKGLFPGCLVYAFEPFDGSFMQLAARAGGLPGIHAFNIALSRNSGE